LEVRDPARGQSIVCALIDHEYSQLGDAAKEDYSISTKIG
jgi:hypothetical protein